MSRPQHDFNMNAMPLQCNRGDKTAIELFLAGIRAMTLQLFVGDIEAACSAGKPSCGDSPCSGELKCVEGLPGNQMPANRND